MRGAFRTERASHLAGLWIVACIPDPRSVLPSYVEKSKIIRKSAGYENVWFSSLQRLFETCFTAKETNHT
jgi:hypothetical protein